MHPTNILDIVQPFIDDPEIIIAHKRLHHHPVITTHPIEICLTFNISTANWSTLNRLRSVFTTMLALLR